MGSTRSRVQILGGLLSLVLPAFEASAHAQAVGFQATPAPLPSGVMLRATPAVSADRRYVRMGVNAGFNDVQGFQNFSVPAAVSGGAAGMNGPVGGAAGVGGPGAGAGGFVGGPGAGVGGLIGGLGPASDFGGGAFGMSGFPYAFAVSGGGFGGFGGGYGPTSGWGDASWNNPGMAGYGGGGMVGMQGYGMQGAGMGMGVPTLPGLGQPLIQDGVSGPFPGAAADPFRQNGPQAGFQQPVQAPPPPRANRSVSRSRSSRSRTARAPRRAVTPRRAPAASAKEADQPPPVAKEETSEESQP